MEYWVKQKSSRKIECYVKKKYCKKELCLYQCFKCRKLRFDGWIKGDLTDVLDKMKILRYPSHYNNFCIPDSYYIDFGEFECSNDICSNCITKVYRKFFKLSEKKNKPVAWFRHYLSMLIRSLENDIDHNISHIVETINNSDFYKDAIDNKIFAKDDKKNKNMCIQVITKKLKKMRHNSHNVILELLNKIDTIFS